VLFLEQRKDPQFSEGMVVGDSPYPSLLSQIIAGTLQTHTDKSTTTVHLLATMRDPVIWAANRVGDHGGDVLCKDEGLTQDGNTVVHFDAFDLVECIDRSIARAKASGLAADEINLADIFMRQETFVAFHTDGEARLARAMERYQKGILKLLGCVRVTFACG
jgi:hypothetical protein